MSWNGFLDKAAATGARLAPLVSRIDALLSAGNERLLVVIDGRCASGKTTLADCLSERYGAAVFRMDDFFLRPGQRTAERLASPGGNADVERFAEEVLAPLRKGELVTYRRYDCSRGVLCEPVTVFPTRLTVIEGSYSLHPALAPAYEKNAVTVFSDVSEEEQAARIRARNPARAEMFFSTWIPMEEAYFAAFSVRERAQLVL